MSMRIRCDHCGKEEEEAGRAARFGVHVEIHERSGTHGYVYNKQS